MSLDHIAARKAARQRKPILSIRGRLILLALLAVVPLMLDRVRLLEASRTERIELAHTEAAAIARRGAEAQLETITTVRALLQVISRADPAGVASADDCNNSMAGFASDIPWLNGVSVVGANGRVLCSNTPTAVGLDISDRAYFQEALHGRQFVLSNYVVDRVRQTPAILAAYPGKDGKSVVIASVDLDWISRLATNIAKNLGPSVFVVDSKGNLLAEQPVRPVAAGKSYADHPLVRAMLARDEATVTLPGLDDVRRIYAFVRIPWTDARLAVGLEESRVLARVEREIGIAYAQLALFGVLVLLVAWFGGERLIVQPIRGLARMAQRFGRGDLDVRAPQEAWATEFAPLANALNEMARKLAAREQELRSANEHLAALASLDSLSGLANRRALDARLSAEWQRAAKVRQPIALLMIDVDHFKLFNDHYGHVEGDETLRRIGTVLAEIAGSGTDLAARYGGEEFALLLPGADLERAIEVAERLREAVNRMAIAHADAPELQVTVSIGVAAMMAHPVEQAARLIEAADAGLYAAKRRGRNAVVAHAATGTTPEAAAG
ncbi:MAG: Phytochromelike protein Cph2 [Xanthobacteraceae bacterium]|nr:Phytochromelike protein Cph2 [Xanthobacteraceae bacterium]